MLVDEAQIEVRGGPGGDGLVAFRREKHVPRGGPSGGDGGRGGNVVLHADLGLRTLLDFTYHHHYRAEAGEPGGPKRLTGRRGEDLHVRVPVGTVVYDADRGERLADLSHPGQTLLVARGGAAGRGSARFATPTRQAPRIAEKGLPGEERHLRLELQLLADVGLVGMPNAGKSTLLSRISAARPRIASYPFTTLEPQLGVVRLDAEREFIVADLPGLIEGAHQGAGLGDRFLRHVRRTRLLLHLVDAAAVDGREPCEDLRTINAELRAYDEQVGALPQIVALTKLDLPGAAERAAPLRAELEQEGLTCLGISAATGEGLGELLSLTWHRLQELTPEAAAAEGELHAELPPPPERPLQVSRQGQDLYEVSGTKVERLMLQSDFGRRDSSQYFHERLRRAGLFRALARAGAADGDTVRIGDQELTYYADPAPVGGASRRR